MKAPIPLWLAILLSLSPTATAQAPPPMFSPWYGDALRDVLRLEQADVDRLERTLARNPEDRAVRLKLMAYERRADRSGRPGDLAKRIGHTLWLIEHHPQSEILHSYVSHFGPSDLSGPQRQRTTVLWARAARAKPRDAAVAWNAASFFEGLDPVLHLRYLEATAAADANHPFALRPLAFLYADSILEHGPLAPAAQAGLDASKNVWVVSNAAYMFQSRYNLSIQRHAPDPVAAQLAERYFLRAQALDPKLDRNTILPQLPPPGPVPSSTIPEDAVDKIRRLPVDAFANLPAGIAGVLRSRRCQVPQPSSGGSPRNVIRGEFMARGEAAWAVLCSVRNSTSLLVFRNAADTAPQTVVSSADLVYVQMEDRSTAVYSRQIQAVNRDFILQHYRAYGGPEPPPIDHAGIDDGFFEKASVTWYYHRGKWLRLQGSD